MLGISPLLLAATVVAALAAVGAASALSPARRPLFVYGLLTLVTGVYLGFAVVEIDGADLVRRAHISALIIEVLIAAVFLTLGLALAASERPWLLGAAFLAHGAVDVAHLIFGGPAPDWYAFLCVLFDAVAGVGFIWLLGKTPPRDNPPVL